jgi:hypothetical protein
MRIGDMQIVEAGGSLPPVRLLKRMAVVATCLHAEYAKPIHNLSHPDKSKESCILSSLTVRDYLRRSGFERASVASVMLVIDAEQDGEQINSLGLGHPAAIGTGWSGHLVVVVNGWIIDTTMYPAIRPAWSHLPGMVAAPVRRDGSGREGMRTMSSVSQTVGGYRLTLTWLENPSNVGWINAPDATRERRLGAVSALLAISQEGAAACRT